MQLDFFMTLQRVLVLFLLIVIGFISGKVGLISKKRTKRYYELSPICYDAGNHFYCHADGVEY